MSEPPAPAFTRRAAFLVLVGACAMPWSALAQEAPEVAAEIRAAVGDGPMDADGITLTMPAVADNGGQVPLTVRVDSPQTEARHVTAIHVFATRNPTPGVASFRLTPRIARAEVQTRIRLAEQQQVIAVAVMNDGSLRRAVADVRVSLGGCLT